MSWKKWPYWARGAMLGIIVSLIIFAYAVINTVQQCKPNFPCPPYWQSYISNLPRSLFDSFTGEFIVKLFIPAIIIGAFLGWFYGKIKNRKLFAKP